MEPKWSLKWFKKHEKSCTIFDVILVQFLRPTVTKKGILFDSKIELFLKSQLFHKMRRFARRSSEKHEFEGLGLSK